MLCNFSLFSWCALLHLLFSSFLSCILCYVFLWCLGVATEKDFFAVGPTHLPSALFPRTWQKIAPWSITWMFAGSEGTLFRCIPEWSTTLFPTGWKWLPMTASTFSTWLKFGQLDKHDHICSPIDSHPHLLSPRLLFLLRWTGSNTNPNNNDGQGRAGTDRSNIVLLRAQNYPEGDPGQDF